MERYGRMGRIFEIDKSFLIMRIEKKIKVVWICHLSNSEIRDHLLFSKWNLRAIARRILKRKGYLNDFAVWNTNAIKEFEKFSDIELHIIAPHVGIKGKIQRFEINGIHYHFFASETDTLTLFCKLKLGKIQTSYAKNTQMIIDEVRYIQPNIVHLIGAENPYYSESLLYLQNKVPLLVSLQTLMSDPNFFKNYPISKDEYEFRCHLEQQIIRKADFIATRVEIFRKIICEQIKPEAKFLDMTLAVGEEVKYEKCKKQYDFVYFAANIEKAVDYAIEAFALVKKETPSITLHVVGDYSKAFMKQLKVHMLKLGLGEEVSFTGKLPTHDDVITEIRKARFALLPLKIDLVSGTIREAMASGLPVVTTITPATPKLNDKRESILLSIKADHQAMADNMLKLLQSETYADKIRLNAIQTINESYNNEVIMKIWREHYLRILTKK